jgi:hypothetical protein
MIAGLIMMGRVGAGQENSRLTNIALLKLQLLYSGIRAGQNLPSPLTNPFGLVHLVLPEGLYRQCSSK